MAYSCWLDDAELHIIFTQIAVATRSWSCLFPRELSELEAGLAIKAAKASTLEMSIQNTLRVKCLWIIRRLSQEVGPWNLLRHVDECDLALLPALWSKWIITAFGFVRAWDPRCSLQALRTLGRWHVCSKVWHLWRWMFDLPIAGQTISFWTIWTNWGSLIGFCISLFHFRPATTLECARGALLCIFLSKHIPWDVGCIFNQYFVASFFCSHRVHALQQLKKLFIMTQTLLNFFLSHCFCKLLYRVVKAWVTANAKFTSQRVKLHLCSPSDCTWDDGKAQDMLGRGLRSRSTLLLKL